MASASPRTTRCFFAFAVVTLTLAGGGCAKSCYPVAGRVLLDGQLLEGKAGGVVLKPDASKDNDQRVAPVGVLQRDGTYSVLTNGRPGAPPGWYKVIVSASDAEANPNEDSPPVLDARYRSETATPLAIEVVASPAPGSYDLQLTR